MTIARSSLLVAAILSFVPSFGRSQTQCPALTFSVCGVRVERRRLVGSDSAVQYAGVFASRKQRAPALTLQGLEAETAMERAEWWYNADVTRRQTAVARFPSDSAVLGPLAPLVDAMPGAGVVIGLIEPDGRTRVISHGTSGRTGVPLGDSTVFEIGSVTKVLTAVVLADMVARGEVAIDDPVTKFLPPSVRVPMMDERPITLLDLATHTSGLPRSPANLTPADSANPYADYRVDQLYAFLSSYSLPRLPGAEFEYSNVGFGLLGHALATRAGLSYDALVRDRLLEPLGMRDTRIVLDVNQKSRFAAGHAVTGKPASAWELPTLAGAGAYRSTLADLLRFANANLTTDQEPAGRALAAARVGRRQTPVPDMGMALGWQTFVRGNEATPVFVWKDGQTGGYSSFVGVDRARHRAVVILANVAGAEALDAVGLGLLRNGVDSSTGAGTQGAATLPDSVLESYVGEYELTPAFHMVVTLANHTLFVQATGQHRLTLLARGARTFDVVGVAAHVRFDVDATGRVVSLVLEQGGKSSPARRVR